jgi:hypothetical protein
LESALSLFKEVGRFQALFDGFPTAFGTGDGRWIKRPPTAMDWLGHLEGKGKGIGIGPLRPDSTVKFAAIDLDEPNFDAAREMQDYIPGPSFIERSRSGCAHVWVFFKDPIEAWVPIEFLKYAIHAAGLKSVEVFPKNHDASKVKLGNYINLPYHGKDRPIITFTRGEGNSGKHVTWTLEGFLDEVAANGRNDPEKWMLKANWMHFVPPEQRERKSEFGTQANLHMCAEHIISGEAGAITEGHRNAVYFALACQLTNWVDCSHDEALGWMRQVNEFSDSVPDQELQRILANAERGEYTGTRCDDPLVSPFTHPDCPIARRA